MNTSQIPSDVSQYTWDVVNKLPEDFIIDGGKEGLETTTIRGKYKTFGITIIYDFCNYPNDVYIEGISTTRVEKKGTVPFEDLTECLEKEFQ